MYNSYHKRKLFNLTGSFIGQNQIFYKLTEIIQVYIYSFMFVILMNAKKNNNLKIALCKVGLMYSKSCYGNKILQKNAQTGFI